jgi:hypothetical protein
MTNNLSPEKSSKASIALLSNVAFLIFSMHTLIKSIDNGSTWKIICASFGFVVFLYFTLLIVSKIMRLKKDVIYNQIISKHK